MEILTGIKDWFVGNWADVANAIAYAISLASIVVKLTPTLADDNALKAIVKFVGKYIALDKYGPKGV
jgi:hypothetical protein